MRAALYARFSSNMQREASIIDQFRNLERYAEQEGWQVVARFEDQAISGSKNDRPGYQAMLAAAKRREFDVLLVDDLSRLSRDEIEFKQTVRRFKFAGLRVIGVSDGFDTNAKGHKIQASVRGLVNDIYLDDLAEKTHRGLTGQALKGFNAGGRSYGYRHLPILDESRRDEYGRPLVIAARREIEPEQASVVREIFEAFVRGRSPRAIAHDLNRRRIPSPRGSTWCISAIYGDRRTGVGILNNPLYAGTVIWNRSRWLRDPDTGKRKRTERPAAEWIQHVDESLRIVPATIWNRAQEKMTRRTHRPGRRHRHLFSGLLKCGICGGAYVKVDRYRYGCATHKDRGPAACGNGMKVALQVAERVLLGGLRQDLMNDEALELFKREVSAQLRTEQAAEAEGSAERRLTIVEREIGHMLAAIKAGAFSDALRRELAAAEAERVALCATIEAQAAMTKLPDFLPRAADLFRDMVQNLEVVLREDSEAAREHLRALLGEEINLLPRPEDQELEAQIPGQGLYRLALKMVAGAESDNVVAGASFGHYHTICLPASGRLY